MPYWAPSLAEEVGSEAAVGVGDEPPILRGEGLVASPTAPGDVIKPLKLSQNDGLRYPPSPASLDGDELTGPLVNKPDSAKGVLDSPEKERPLKLSEGKELNAVRGGVKPAGTPTETGLQPSLEPEPFEVDTQPSDGDYVRQFLGPEIFKTGTQPSSPACSHNAEELYDYTIPPFQWSSKELNVLVDSHWNDFESPSVEATTPYQPHIGKVSMRATDWTYYQVQDEVRPMEYHPDWPNELQELGPIMLPAGGETGFNQKRIPPQAPTYCGRTLQPKIANLKQQMSWGNLQEQPAILKHMWKTDEAIQRDPDWKATLLERILDIRFILLLYCGEIHLIIQFGVSIIHKNISIYGCCLVGKPEWCNAQKVRRKWLSSHYVLLRIKVHLAFK